MAVSPACPICRQEFNPKKVTRDKKIEKALSSLSFPCWACNAEIPALKMRLHMQNCSRIKEQVCTLQMNPSQNQPASNRSTFCCPICGQANLDTFALVKHVDECHRNSPYNSSVVCPVCAAMPWGNKNQKTSDFVGHMLKRHNFEYHTYVDYEADEDAILAEIIAKSMTDN